MRFVTIQKLGATMRLSIEDFAYYRSRSDPRYKRLVASQTEIAPTNEQMAEYNRALELFAELETNRYFSDGGYEYGASIDKPTGRREYTYAETHEEWLDRVRALLAEENNNEH